MSGLDIRSREALLKGGKRGPSIIPGKPEESLVFRSAAHKGDLIMPPGSKSPLPSEELAVLKAWLEEGAPWPAASKNTETATRALAILATNCVTCHGASQTSGLDMRSRETLLKGGKRGAAIAPGRPDDSLLFRAASHIGELSMPPASKEPLPAGDLQVLKKWIEEGAEWPVQDALRAARPSWWSFQPVRRPKVPTIKSAERAANPIDAFILAKLQEKKLTRAPRADKTTLVRRAYYDLLGLPPTPEQVDRFVKDTSPEAFEKLVDELLASPHYGERWGRHWLDVVRYADSAGYEGDIYYPNAWRYRDYVIKSLNEDKPYDRFVQEQIAGDELWPNNMGLEGLYGVPPVKLEHLEARIGTTLYTFGAEIQESNLDYAKLRSERLTDAADTTGSAFLGLTFACSRCHDHKFDPISQRDYYGLQAVFAASEQVRIPVVTGMTTTHRDEGYPFMVALDEARIAHRALEKRVKDRVFEPKKAQFTAEALKAFKIPSHLRTPAQGKLALPVDKVYGGIKVEEQLTPEERIDYDKSLQRLAKAALAVPPADASHMVQFDGFFDTPEATVLRGLPVELIPETWILERGDFLRRTEKVGAALPRALLDGHDSPELEPGPGGPRYRKQFALWLTDPEHPLTARVMVNRIWQGHFGRGLVATANDFGRQGLPPSHPELLDWLAAEFMAQGWSMKSLHRQIMLSETYQRDSRFVDDNNRRVDPDNLYLWRMNRRRLEAEAVWDYIHATSGDLYDKMGGRPIMPPISESETKGLRNASVWVTPGDERESHRRGVYIMIRRGFSFPLFDKFDMPDNGASCPRRDETTVAPQLLWTLNNRTSFEEARRFAARLVREAGPEPVDWVDRGWNIALSRSPTSREKTEALAFIEKLAAEAPKLEKPAPLPPELAKLGADRADALTKLCLAIFNLNEFVYID